MTNIRRGMFLALLLSALPSAALAEFKATPAQLSACRGDAFRLCSGHLTSMDTVAACLISKKSELSPGCRATYDGGGKSAAKK